MSEIVITLPTLHTEQVKAYKSITRFFALRCGRRWGKTAMMSTIAANEAIKGRYVGWFTPDYRIMAEAFHEMTEILQPLIKSSSKIDGIIRLKNGGKIEFWTLNNKRAGRSRKYHLAILDEIAFAGNDMSGIWAKAIRPTLLDFGGRAIAASTPNGDDPDNFFWQICNLPELGFTHYHAPTSTNPHLPVEEVVKLELENAPLVFRQEYQAEFVDWTGAAFFSPDSMTVNGFGVEPESHIDGVFAVMDTAVKSGQEHDATAIIYFATSKFMKHRLVILDYELVQIDGAFLENMMPAIYKKLEDHAVQFKARFGSLGVYIEDKASGSILIQKERSKGSKVHAIDSKLTAYGKDERAISVSSYVYQKQVMLSNYAHDKVINFKGLTRNHLITQVCGFRLGDKDAYKRADDLLDCFCYGIAIALGNYEGY